MNSVVAVGQPAPTFRLPSAAGGEVDLASYRGRSNVIVWFTKGMACPFCRTHMSQLGRGVARFRDLGTEVVEITGTKPSRGALYAKKFRLPFPYLCDPEYVAHRAWGLDYRSHSLLWYVQAFRAGSKLPSVPGTEFGPPKPDMGDLPTLLTDEDVGFFIVDRDGILRYRHADSYMGANGVRPIPSNEEIEKELLRIDGGKTTG
jgi:peroxiredoxin